jgi:hypothetical protein
MESQQRRTQGYFPEQQINIQSFKQAGTWQAHKNRSPETFVRPSCSIGLNAGP